MIGAARTELDKYATDSEAHRLAAEYLILLVRPTKRVRHKVLMPQDMARVSETEMTKRTK